MLTQEQGLTEVSGLHVYDMVVIKHMIEKLLSHGLVSGKELAFVAALRARALAAAQVAVGVNIEEFGTITKQGG